MFSLELRVWKEADVRGEGDFLELCVEEGLVWGEGSGRVGGAEEVFDEIETCMSVDVQLKAMRG